MNEAPPSLLRAFFALDPPAAFRACMDEAIGPLHRLPNGDHIRWVKSENRHVTLKFFAALDPGIMPSLVASVAKELAGVKPFRCRLGALQLFPSQQRPRVLAWELEPAKPVLELARAVERGAVACGFTPEDRPFRAHLTVARLRSRRVPDLNQAPVSAPAEWPIREILLIQSDLQPNGTVYTVQHRLPLAD